MESEVIFDRKVIDFVKTAAEFCVFVENTSTVSKKTFVDTSLKILPLLYLNASLLPSADFINEDEPLEECVTESMYDNVRQSVAAVLGSSDDYLEVFVSEMEYSDQPIKKNVSEDIADIYQDIRNFTFVFSLGLNQTMNDSLALCQQNFAIYWGQKLVNTMRALHSIKYSEQEEYEDEEETVYSQDLF